MSFGSPRPSGLARNVASNWIAFAFEAGITFFLSPFVIHTLGGTAFGAWVLVVSMTGYLGFLDLGVRNAVTRFVSRFRAQGDHAAASLTVSSALGIFAVTGAVAITVSLIASGLVLPWFNVEPTLARQAQIALILSGFSVAAWLINGIFSGVTVAVQRFDALNTVAITVGVGRAIAVVIVLGAGGGLVGLASVELGVALARCLANTWLAHRVYPELRVRIGFGGAPQIRMIFSFSLFSFFLDMANDLIYLSDAVVIGASLPLVMVTFFAIAANLRNYARGLVAGLANVFYSRGERPRSVNGPRHAPAARPERRAPCQHRGAADHDHVHAAWCRVHRPLDRRRVRGVVRPCAVGSLAGADVQRGESGVAVGGIGDRAAPAGCAGGPGRGACESGVERHAGPVDGHHRRRLGGGAAEPRGELAILAAVYPGAIGVRVVDYVTTAWVRPGVALIPFFVITYAIERFSAGPHPPRLLSPGWVDASETAQWWASGTHA